MWFHEEDGIRDIQFGVRHGLYVTEKSSVKAWDDGICGRAAA